MKDWIKSKQGKTILLLGALQGFILLNGILPSYENLAYFQKKVTSLKGEQQQLQRFVEQMNYYQEELLSLKKVEQTSTSSSFDFKEWRKQEQQFSFLEWKQEIRAIDTSPFFSQFEVSLSLIGTYEQHREHFQNLFLLPQDWVLIDYSLRNLEWLSENPKIEGKMKIRFLQPK